MGLRHTPTRAHDIETARQFVEAADPGTHRDFGGTAGPGRRSTTENTIGLLRQRFRK